MAWQESKPSPSDLPNAELVDLLRSQKTHFSAYLGKHFFWTEASAASAGIPRLSDGSPGPGSAHAFYDTASRVSHASAGGKLFVTSDTSRLYGLHSAGSALLGSAAAIVYAGASTSLTTVANNVFWLVQSSFTTTNTTNNGTVLKVTFPTPYGAPPFVELTPICSSATQATSSSLSAVGTSSMSVYVCPWATGNVGFYWRSIGTVLL